MAKVLGDSMCGHCRVSPAPTQFGETLGGIINVVHVSPTSLQEDNVGRQRPALTF